MKLTTILFIFISTLGLSQTPNDSITYRIFDEFESHLDSIGIDIPINIECINDAAVFHANYLTRNKVCGHKQGLLNIGDTIIPKFTGRGYFFCDTLYSVDSEIAASFPRSNMDILINESPGDVIAGFLSSPKHKEILEKEHSYYGIGISISKDEIGYTLVVVIVYGETADLGRNSRYPSSFSINKDAESNYRKLYDNNITIR